MALPKEPRQKMINMMYLVLTALLALNVSSEILHAFKVVDNSLISSNGVVDNSNKVISSSLAEQGKKPELASKVAIWKPRADAAIKMANDLSANIEALKLKLKQAAGLQMVDGKEEFKESDLEAATHLMGVAGEGPKLQAALDDFSKKIVEIVPDTNRRKSPLPKLPIDVSVPETQNIANASWTDAYFHMTPTVAALTILSKFQNDVLRSGNIVAEYCQAQIGKVEVILDKFEILTSQNSSYLLPGQTLEIKAGIGAFSSAAKPSITIGGSTQIANDSGFARSLIPVSGGSGGAVPISVSFKDPSTGQVTTKTSVVNYTVGTPSGASIFLTKMNVMYVGVDNPFTISSGSGKFEKTTVSFTAGAVSGSGADRSINPTATGPATLTVSVEGKNYPFPIRCKNLPDPVPLVGTQTGGRMSAAQFRQMGGLRAQLKDSDFDAKFEVVSYTMAGNGAGFSQYTPVNLSSAQWGTNSVINQCKPGSTVFFDDIIVKGPDKKPRKLPSIAFQLQ